jgi:hypothetical protein
MLFLLNIFFYYANILLLTFVTFPIKKINVGIYLMILCVELED